jgi:O-antigen/teichoic acid export membrane protein
MSERRVITNALAGAVQVVLCGLLLIFLYRYLYDSLGIERFGVWALIMAAASASGIAGLGLGMSVVKFVAQHQARDDKAAVSRVVETATVSIAVLVLAALPLLYPLLRQVLPLLIDEPTLLQEGLVILPYSLLAFWLISVGTVFQGALDGIHRVDLRAVVVTGGYALLVGQAFFFVPLFGLLGIALAQIGQSAFLCVIGWVVFRRQFHSGPVIPYRWHRSTFREMIGYGLNFQAISISALLFEPTTKALLAYFGGIASTGYYELAYRMATFLRSIVVGAHQALVPTLARLAEINPNELHLLYRDSMRAILLFLAVILPGLLLIVPVLADLWLGERPPLFIVFAVILLSGWFVNLISNPAYFSYMGTGRLRWNTVSHVFMVVSNLILGFSLGLFFGGVGVVSGFAVSLVLGAILLTTIYQKESGIHFSQMIEASSLKIAVTTVSLSGLGYAIILLTNLWTSVFLLVGALYLVVVGTMLSSHPVRTLLESAMKAGIPIGDAKSTTQP